MEQQKRVGVFGNYGVGNLGDERMLQIFMDLVRDEGADPVVFCGRPQQVQNHYGIETGLFFPSGFTSFFRVLFSREYRQELRTSAELLSSCDTVVFGGGGLFVDQKLSAVVLWCIQLAWCIANKKRVFLLSQTFTLDRFFSRFFSISLLKRAQNIVVRDRESQRLLKDSGIDSFLLPDITFLKPLIGCSRENVVCVSLRESGLGKYQKNCVVRFLKDLEVSYEIRLLVFQDDIYNDLALYKELELPYPMVRGAAVLESLSVASFVLGMRFHCIVFALQAGVPFLALSYQQKVRSFVEEASFPSLVLDVNDISYSVLCDRFNSISSESDVLRDALHASGEKFHELSAGYRDFFLLKKLPPA
jgi:polysaccharide pyruvyl transferase WcaK-like protein